MHTKWYLYILYDPTFISQTFYVGYSYHPSERLQEHIDIKNENKDKDEWIDDLGKRNVEPAYFVVADFATELLVCYAEIQLISFCKAIKLNICNKSPGGNAPPIQSGEQHRSAKLKRTDVDNIRELFLYKNVSKRELFAMYPQMAQGSIRDILYYNSWADPAPSEETLKLLKERLREDRAVFYKEHSANMSGANNNRTKMNESSVCKIRELFSTGNYTKAAISKLFNTTPENIAIIIKRKTWQHI